MKKAGQFKHHGILFTVWQDGAGIALSCESCGLVEIGAWDKVTQSLAMQCINKGETK